MKSFSNFSKTLLIFLFSVLFCFIFCEITLRIYFSSRFGPRNALYENCPPPLYYELIKGVTRKDMRTNTLGFRGSEPEPVKNKIRVACIGDSFTFGVCLPENDTIPSQMQKMLGITYEVFNFGVTGYNMSQYYYQFKLKVLPLKPDYAFFFCCFNDSEDIENSTWIAEDDHTLLRRNSSSTFSMKLLRKSFFLRVAAAFSSTLARYVVPQEEKSQNCAPTVIKDIFVKISELCRQNNCEPVFVLIPSRNDLNSTKNQRTIYHSLLSELNLPVILPDSEFSGDPDRYFLKADVHYNSRGTELIARISTAFILN